MPGAPDHGGAARPHSSAATTRQAATRTTFLMTYWPSRVGTGAPLPRLPAQQQQRGEDAGHVGEEPHQGHAEQHSRDEA
ncbi:hypothetical protein ACH49_29355 [Streptomyces leeuwenhoekii]|uniref:Uncharacterized protein n=1 Tax=Streptomyces leeuwenhoekii TaxID=1437453 RepID=A0ABR5HQL5_STRLW|nr:hypothetical protein ACH49_29355 [Streptomyces leeuwenhoekii]